MNFRKAAKHELEAVFSLYRSVVGKPYCVWNDDYPGWLEIDEDFENGTLYVMEENDAIIGAISIVVHNELDDLTFWEQPNAREIARVVVAPGQQGRGIAQRMVEEIASILRTQGVGAIHLLVAEANPPAQSVYSKCSFRFHGTCFMFGHNYIGCEKILKAAPHDGEWRFGERF